MRFVAFVVLLVAAIIAGVLTRLSACLVCLALIGSCSRPSTSQSCPDELARKLTDSYLSAYFDRYPEEATVYGVPGRHHDHLRDNSLQALAAWQVKEDQWIVDARTISQSAIQDRSLRAAYAIAREALESSAAERVCRQELWNVSQMSGWQVDYGYLITIQPVGTEQSRTEALTRWNDLPRFLDTEVVNLREGIKLGYTAPKNIVSIVIGQVDGLLSESVADALARTLTGFDLDNSLTTSLEHRIVAAAPSQIGELSYRLIGGEIIDARLYFSNVMALRNIALGLFTPLLCALMLKGAKQSCATLYSCM